MSLKEKVLADLKSAMKEKDEMRLSAVRLLQAAIKNKEIELRPNEITDADIIAVARKMTNQMKDSIEQYEKAGRQELVDKEKAQLVIVEDYLPQQMARADLEKLIDQVIQEVKATSMKEMGQVIKATMAKAAGAADGKLVSEIAKSKLS